MKVNVASLLVIALFAVVFFWKTSGLPWTPYRVAGLAIATPALLLLVVARLQLGRAFSIRPKASTLITTGLYSRIRNPIYVFGSVFIVGLSILIEIPWFLLILIPIIPMQIWRSRNEAALLEEKFGDEYRVYRQKTWF
jgi:protein-S-isoprenylcysteine O-methyltransferase Ste14